MDISLKVTYISDDERLGFYNYFAHGKLMVALAYGSMLGMVPGAYCVKL